MVGNGLIGFGDACLQTGMYNYIGYTHPHNCAPALAHLKSVRVTIYLTIHFGISACRSTYK